MSMEHKAFLFRYREFEAELLPILEKAVASGDPKNLVAFINANRGGIRDPYEGEPLSDDWEMLLEVGDAQQYGDFALTKYYDPTDDRGLGRGWMEIQSLLERSLGESAAILGRPVGADEVLFDPGRAGSYFQSSEEVKKNLAEVSRVRDPLLASTLALLEGAVEEGAGLYVTF